MTSVAKRAQEIVSSYKGKKGVLIHVLQDIQGEFGYLPGEAVRVVSEELGIPLAEIYGVATFYTRFYFVPRGKNIIRVCRGTACHVRGSGRILGKLEEGLGVKSSETSPDLKFTLETVNCVGCCALAPVVVVNDKAQTVLNPDKILAALKGSRDNGQD